MFLSDYSQAVIDQTLLLAQIGDPRSQISPDIAFNGKNSFVVTWQQGENYFETESGDIMAIRLDENGKPQDSGALKITNHKASQERPRIASYNNHFLIVWQDFRNGKDWDIYGARISQNGKLLDPDGFLIAGGKGNQAMASITNAGNGYMIVWQDFSRPPYYQLNAALVTNEGVISIKQKLQYSGSPLYGGQPEIAYDGKNYLITWFNEKDWTKSNGLIGITTRWFAKLDIKKKNILVTNIKRSPTVLLGRAGGNIKGNTKGKILLSGWGKAGRGNRMATGALFNDGNLVPLNNPNIEKKRRYSGWDTSKMIIIYNTQGGIDGPVSLTWRNDHWLIASRTITGKRHRQEYRIIGSRLDKAGKRLDGPKQWPLLYKGKNPVAHPVLSSSQRKTLLVFEKYDTTGISYLHYKTIPLSQ